MLDLDPSLLQPTPEHRPLFDALMALVEAAKVEVHMHAWFGDFESFGRYVPFPEMGVDVIKVYASSGHCQRPGSVVDVMVFAHEYGHCQAFRAGEWSEPYLRASKVDRESADSWLDESPEIRREVITEEGRAWVRARETLMSVGFSDWPLFDDFSRSCLATYQEALGHGLD